MTRRDRIRRVATWASLVLAVAGAAAFVALRDRTPSDGGRVAFYDRAWSADGVAIAPIDPPAAGLQAGDIVAAVGGRTLEAWLADAANPGAPRPAPGATVAYELERGGAPLRVDIAWAQPGIGATLVDGLSIVVLSIAFAAVAAFVFAKRPDEPAAVPIVLAGAAIAGSSVPWFVGVTVSDVVLGWPFVLQSLLTGPLYMLLWPAGLHLALVFPAPWGLVTRHPWLVPAAYVLGLGAYAAGLVAARLASPTTLEWVGAWPLVQVAVIVPLLLVSTTLFVVNSLRTRDPVVRNRVRWVLFGGAASGAVGLILFWLPQLLLRERIVSDAWIGVAALPVPLGLAAAILRDRLFDIDVVVNRTLVYGGLTVGVLASYAAATSAMSAVVGTEHGFGVSLLATGGAALLALPLRDGLQRAVNRLMYGDRDEPWRALRRLGQRLEWAAGPELAFPAIAETVADSLRLPYVALTVVDESGGEQVVAEHGVERGPTIALPLAHGSVPVGRLVLGHRPGEKAFRLDERGLLEDLARQAGAAVHAIRLRADLARSRERLVLAREEERRRLRRDLHDGLGPSLAAIGMRAEASAETIASDPDAARRLLGELGEDVRTALADIRRLVDGLRPPALDELGLLGAIGQQATRLEGRGRAPAAGIAIEVRGRPSPLPELAAAVEVAAYRIAVEALTNAVRHADARTCEIRLDATDARTLTVEVVDDGRGLPADVVPGIGLESIRARADELGGSVRVERRRRGGTRVLASLPLEPLRP